MKKKLIRWQKLLVFVLALCLIVPALSVPVRAASSITVWYGNASQSAASFDELILISADETQYPFYDPERIVYEFIGWDTDPSGGYDLYLLGDPYSYNTFFYMPNHDVVFYADFNLKFKPAMPTITGVYPGDESCYITFEPSSDISWPPPAYYILTDGYIYETIPGDATSYNITGLVNGSYYYFELIPVHDDVRGKSAQFVADPYQTYYAVTYLSDEDIYSEVFYQDWVGEGDLAVPPADPVREGYRFLGWYNIYDSSVKIDFSMPIWGDCTFFAKWEELPKYYDVAFFSDDSADATLLSEQSIKSGDLAVQPADPVREGYTFLGWYQSYDTSVKVDFSEPIRGNSAFIAKWEELKVKVTFDSDGGTEVAEQEVKKGETVVRPPHPVKEGFTFFGWFDGDTRYDFRRPVEADLALKAHWRPVGKPIDLNSAIGPEGQFDGELSRAIGLTGTYDAAQFRVLPAYPYPSIRLELIDTPDAAIVFSSLPNFRGTDSDDAAGPNQKEKVMSFPYRLMSLTHFEQKCVPDQIVQLEGKDREGIGDDELAYALHSDREQKLLANDFVTYFPASTGIIHLEYPEENAELTKGRLIHALSSITFAEGTRPAIAFAAFDLAQTDIGSVDQIVANLTTAESFFDKNLTDLRLNAELAENIYHSSEADLNTLAMAVSESEKSQGNESISKEKQTELETEFEKLSPFGFKADFPVDDAGNTCISISFSRSKSLARYREFLPVSYSLLIDSYEEIENVANEQTDLNNTEQWQRKLRSATELCLFAADPLIAGDAPEWRDPVLRRERNGMTMYLLNSSFFHHANDDATLNQAVYDAWKAYEEEIKEIEAGLPAGYFASHIGPYANFILEFKKKIDERSLVPFTQEEAETIFREMDFYNNNLPEQNDQISE